jgi:hypothetical protein
MRARLDVLNGSVRPARGRDDVLFSILISGHERGERVDVTTRHTTYLLKAKS